MAADDLMRWARPEDVLTPRELKAGRKQQYLQLFAEQLARLAADPAHPQMVEVFAARVAANALWAIDRNGRSGPTYQQLVEDERSRVCARQAMFAELDLDYRLVAAAYANLKFADDLLKMARLGEERVPHLVEVA